MIPPEPFIPPGLLILTISMILAVAGLGSMLKGLSMRKDLVKARMFLHFDTVLRMAHILVIFSIILAIAYAAAAFISEELRMPYTSLENFLYGWGFFPSLIMLIAAYVGFRIYFMLR